MSSVSPPGTDGPVFVTGGTGFVGSHLVEALHAQGHTEVRCLVRRAPGWLEEIAHTPVRGDLHDGEVLSRAMRGCRTVYHIAALTRSRDWDTFEKVNIDGTVSVLDAAAAQPDPPRVIVLSSLAAVGRADGIANEETPLAPVSMYGRSKAIMEERVADYHDRLPITVIRPPAVYGPRDTDIYTVFQTAQRGLFAVVGGEAGPAVTLVHVSDLVRGILAAARADVTVGRTYFIGADPPHSWKDFRDAAARALGRRVMTLSIPRGLVIPVGTTVELAGRLVGTYPPLNREKAMEIRYACTRCTSERARQEFGYEASIPLEEGFEDAVKWYRSRGWLPGAA